MADQQVSRKRIDVRTKYPQHAQSLLGTILIIDDEEEVEVVEVRVYISSLDFNAVAEETEYLIQTNRIQSLQRQLLQRIRNLNRLQEQASKHPASFIPNEIVNQITDEEIAINDLRKKLGLEAKPLSFE